MLLCASSFGDHILQNSFDTTDHKEIDMSKVLSQARPIIEATVVSVVLVLAALAVPAVILYTAI